MGKVALEIGKQSGWINWMARHPGLVLLGALAVAILAARQAPDENDPGPDSSQDEVPLFI